MIKYFATQLFLQAFILLHLSDSIKHVSASNNPGVARLSINVEEDARLLVVSLYYITCGQMLRVNNKIQLGQMHICLAQNVFFYFNRYSYILKAFAR